MTSQIKVFPEDSEENVQKMWYDRIGKFLGFPQSGSRALWTKNADRFGGQGTFIVRVFPNVNYRTIAWNGFTGGDGLKSSESLPLMTRTIGRTDTKIVFFAGVYGWKEALRSYNEAGEVFVNRNDKLEDLISSYKLANPNIEPDPVPEGQTRLDDFSDEKIQAKKKIEEFYSPTTGHEQQQWKLSDQEKRMQLMQLMHDLAPEDLFNQTQNTMISAHKDKWILTVIAPPKQGQGNIHFPKYMSDGFVPFMEYSEKLIKYLDRQANYGHEEFNKINYYFKKIAEKGDFADQDSDAKWYVRPPDNFKNILEMFGAYERLPLQKTFFGIKKSSVDWKTILKRNQAMSPSPPDDNDDKPKAHEKFITNKHGKKIVNPFYRKQGDTFIIDGKEVTEGTWKDSPLGQRQAITSNWENSCCQRLKEQLIELLIVEIKQRGKDIHESKIRQTVSNMTCSELSEYMEPPGIEQNNFHNLQFFGIKIGDISQQVFMEALDLQGDIHATLYEDYSKCLEYHHSSVIKPPSETTDPIKDKIDVPSGDVTIEVDVPKHREFEGFTFDTNTKEGELTDAEKTTIEQQREQVIHGKRKDMDDLTFQEEHMTQPMQEEWWKQQQKARNKPSEKQFKRLVNYAMKILQQSNTPISSVNVRGAINWGDSELMKGMKFSRIKWDYAYTNWTDLYNEMIT